MYSYPHATDFDTLVSQCMNRHARTLMEEAVACYRSGAYRAAIVTTWTALCYDYVDKLLELKASGHKDAGVELKKYERAWARIESGEKNAYKATVILEREMLDDALKLKLIVRDDYIHLTRLREDRNKCAHVSARTPDDPYSPIPDVARAHISNALRLFLCQPATVGKAAIDQIMKTMEERWFKDDIDFVREQFPALAAKPRESLLRALIHQAWAEHKRHRTQRRYIFLIKVIREKRPDVADAQIRKILERIVHCFEDSEGSNVYTLNLVFDLLCEFLGLWDLLTPAVRSAVLARVSDVFAHGKAQGVGRAFLLPFLKEVTDNKIQSMSMSDLCKLDKEFKVPDVFDRIVDEYLSLDDFREVCDGGDHIRGGNVERLTEKQASRIITEGGKRSVIKATDGFTMILKMIKRTDVLGDKFNSLLAEAGLGDLLSEEDDERHGD